MSTEADEQVRAVTEEEVAHYREHGWAYLPGLIDRGFAHELLGHLKELSGFAADELPMDTGERAEVLARFDGIRYHLVEEDPWFGGFLASKRLGEAAARLSGIRPLRLFSGSMLVKLPQSSGAQSTSFHDDLTLSRTPWHQDFSGMPLDRRGAIAFWFALCPITPDMGSMRYMSGSHRAGPLGGTQIARQDMLALYPELEGTYPVSEPLTLEPGDVLTHDSLTLHCAPANRTNKVRWVLTSTRMPAHAHYNGIPNGNTDRFGLRPWQSFDHPAYPIVTA